MEKWRCWEKASLQSGGMPSSPSSRRHSCFSGSTEYRHTSCSSTKHRKLDSDTCYEDPYPSAIARRTTDQLESRVQEGDEALGLAAHLAAHEGQDSGPAALDQGLTAETVRVQVQLHAPQWLHQLHQSTLEGQHVISSLCLLSSGT